MRIMITKQFIRHCSILLSALSTSAPCVLFTVSLSYSVYSLLGALMTHFIVTILCVCNTLCCYLKHIGHVVIISMS